MKIKIGTYNIQHCLDHLHFLRDGAQIISTKPVADVIRKLGLDVCGLNEVYNQEMLEGENHCNQAKEIAAELGYYYHFAKAIDYRGYEYGNALVSRFPIVSARSVPLVLPEKERLKPRYENRVILIAELDVNGAILTVIVSHFGLSEEEKEFATRTLLSELRNIETPIIFMGDLNLTPETAQICRIREALFDTSLLSDPNQYTFSSSDPHIKIDYIFVNEQITPLSSGVSSLIYSDHLPVFCEISF